MEEYTERVRGLSPQLHFYGLICVVVMTIRFTITTQLPFQTPRCLLGITAKTAVISDRSQPNVKYSRI